MCLRSPDEGCLSAVFDCRMEGLLAFDLDLTRYNTCLRGKGFGRSRLSDLWRRVRSAMSTE